MNYMSFQHLKAFTLALLYLSFRGCITLLTALLKLANSLIKRIFYIYNLIKIVDQ